MYVLIPALPFKTDFAEFLLLKLGMGKNGEEGGSRLNLNPE